MYKYYEKLFFAFVLLFLSFGHLSAQDKLWPGDANNNGVTNCVDLLYIGVGFDETGPQRTNATTLWQEQDVDSLWTNDYADSTTNFAYGDCNGDGVINEDDLVMAIKANYLLTHNSSSITNNADAYVEGVTGDPVLTMTPNITSVNEGEEFKIDFNLGDIAMPIDSFYGVAMVISYDKPYVSLSAPVQFNAESNAFTDPSNGVAVNTIHTDTTSRQVEFAYVRTNKINAAEGYGKVGTFSFIIDDDVIAPLIVDSISIKVDSVRLIDKNLNSIPVDFAAASFKVEVVQNARSSNPVNCPQVLDPVCGSDGVTYMNSCFAKAAGITDYTSGVCFGECIDPQEIDPISVADCSNNYIPVCGCNDVTYLNSCVAENSGVTEYTLGACVLNSSCFDPTLVASSSGVDIDRNTGIISENCPSTYEPVCGCDGFTYQNSCRAEASGISFYTQGPCNNVCVDADMMDPHASCVNVYEPVCGCNDVTYTNACFADAAGVVSYTPGACGATTVDNWCAEATPIECGDYLASETTIGAGNDIESYYWNASVKYLGADKVYVINKDQAGDLQIGLEIITPGVNLDLFLLSGDCDNLTCIGASQSNNQSTNNEGIVLENAPIGTYYIVVDGLLPSYQGDFKLEVSCGNLDCNDAIQLSCGQAFNYNNTHGQDNVSAYGCGNVLNVENNGNEVVHTFTLTQTGQVDIYLTNLNENLELFLLEECDRGDCVKFSSHPGTTNEHISTLLQPGTYYVVVDGYNGATSNYQLLVDCPSSCNIDVDVTATGTNCGQSNGSFTVTSTGGTAGYIVSWTGPISGSFTTYSNTCTIYNIPPGVYTVTKTDANGCHDSEVTEVKDLGSHLEANLLVKDAVCSTKGSVNVSLSNGQAPYVININGPISGTATSASNNFNINQLPAGDYTIFITDKFGCTVSKTFTVQQNNNNFTVTGYTTPSQCESLGKIHISLANGAPKYTIQVTGPVSGSATTYSSNFNIPNLPGGTYTVLIEDGNWCSDEMIFVIEEKDIDIDLVATNGICGENGALTINISNGLPQYNISWSGPTNGSVTSNASTFTIPNLQGGAYSVTVMDANWCQAYQVATIDNTVGTLDVDISIIDGTCDAGSVWIDINDGSAPYAIDYSGPQNGSGTTSTNGFDISNLTPGTYTINITDANNCTYTEVVIIDPNNSTINVNAWPNDGSCGELGNLEVTVTNGTSPYTISYAGPASNTVTSTSPVFIIDDLVSGNYSIEVTDENGCMDWVNTMINNTGSGMTISTAPWNGTCGTPGEITVEIDGGTPGYNVSWDGPTSGAATSAGPNYTINNVLSGSYGVTVTDNDGCSDSGIQIIDNDSNDLSLTLTGTNGMCGNPGSIVIAISGASGPYSVEWSGPLNGSGTTTSSFNISNAVPGTYWVAVTSADGCTQNEEIEIINEGNPILVTSSTTASVCGSGGSINIMYDAPDAVISWTGVTTGSANSTNGVFSITDLPEGWYDVLVSVGNGCDIQIGEEIIAVDNNVDFTVTPIDAVCQSKGSALVTFGSGQYDIVWSGPVNGNIIDNSGSYTIQNLPAGDYSITLIDIDGCKTTKSFSIAVENTVVNVEAIGTNGICNTNGSIEVSFDIGAGVVSWVGPLSGSSSSNTGSFSILDLTPGTYEITVEASNGCTGTTSVVLENVVEQVNVTATSTDGICQTNGSLTINTDATNVTYSGPISGSGTPTNGLLSVGNAPAGTYTVVATSANGCTVEIMTELVSSTTNLNLSGNANNGVCDQNGSIDLTFVTGDIVIDWSGPSSGSATTTAGNMLLADLMNGTYTVTATDVNGCTMSIEVTVMNVGSTISLTSNINDASCCDQGSVDITVSGSAGALTYAWMPNVSTTSFATDLTEGMYSVTVTDENGCSTNASFTVLNDCVCPDIFDVDTIYFDGTKPEEVCVPIPFLDKNLYNIILNDLDYMLPVQACDIDTLIQYSYVVLFGLGQDGPYMIDEWQANGQTFSGQVQTMQDLTDSLNVWDPTGGWTHQPAQFSIVGGDSSGAYGSIKATHLGSGVQSTMNINFTGIATGFGVEVNNDKPTQELIIMDTVLCCSDTVIIVFGGGCDIAIAETHTDAICDATGSVTFNVSNGLAPYTINQTGAAANTFTSSTNSILVNDLAAGSYQFVIADSDGCAQTMDIVINSSNSNVSVSAVAQNDMCGSNGSVNINATGGAADYDIQITGPVSHSQSSTSGSVSFDGLTDGSYTVNITDANGCGSSTSFVINNSTNSNLNVSATAVNGSCGQTPGFLLNISGGTPVYTLTWTGPENGSTTTNSNMVNMSDLASGTYDISIVDSNGCNAVTTVTITNDNGNFDANISVTNAYCDVLGSIWITVNSGTPPYLVEWTGVQSGSYSASNVINDISNLPVGTYTATITDANACSASQTIEVLENGAPTVFAGTVSQPTNTNDGSVLIEIVTNNPDHTVSWTGPTSGTVTVTGQFFNITSLTEGTYTISVDDKDGCSSTQTFVLTNSGTGTGTGSGGSSFAINVTPTDMTCGNPGNLFLNLNNGVAPYTITWSGAASGTDVTSAGIYNILNLGMGNYTVTVTDAQNNSTIGSANIGGSGAFEIITSTNNGSCGNDDGSISVEVISGASNYSIFWSGPVSNNATFNNNAISIDDLPSGTYDITVSDANACPQIFTTTVNNSAGAPTGSFTSTSNALTTTFTNSASSGLYSWDFGDGSTSAATNPSHEYCDAGTYTVCLTVTNTCGANTICNDVTVSLPTDVVILDVQNGAGATGSSISIPVTIANCETIVTLAGSLEVANDALCTIDGISPGVISPNYISASSTFNYVNNNGNGVSVADGDILFYIDVTLTGEANESTTIHITDSPLQVEVGSMVAGLATVLPSIELKGIVSISSSARISGNVKTYWGEGIENTQITILSDNLQNTQMTDSDGYFMEPDLPMGEMYSVLPERDFNDQNGLSSYALFVGQRFILGLDPIEIVSPYQVIAGDANCSNSFTTIDLFILQQLIIGTAEGLDFCPSWTFVQENDQMPADFDAYNVFPYNSSDQVMVMSDEVSNFVGVKVGDILGHANPSNFADEDLSKAEGILDLYINEVSVNKGETFELNFSSNNFDEIVSYQLGLSFDQAMMSFEEVEKSDHEDLLGLALGDADADTGSLRASWFSLDGQGLSVDADEKLFTLRFKATEDIENILDYVSLSNKSIRTEAHNEALQQLEVVLNVSDTPLTSVNNDLVGSQFELKQNTPNPFTGFTQIEFTLPRSMQADLTITNVLGETVKVISQVFNEGENLITLSQNELGTGVFHYTLTAQDLSITKSMISLK